MADGMILRVRVCEGGSICVFFIFYDARGMNLFVAQLYDLVAY